MRPLREIIFNAENAKHAEQICPRDNTFTGTGKIMTDEEIKAKVLEVLGSIASEADLNNIKPDKDFRDQLDIDSMDYLNFVIALDEAFQGKIPEPDYTKFINLDACVNELKKSIGRVE
jgi:acyl carrier protein